MSDLMTVAIEAAREAGAFLHSRFRRALTIETKEDRSLVTDVDREAERLIVERIASSFPGHDVLAEERGRRSQGSDHCWIIDPMDGTHNYIRGMGAYGVSIGVQKGDAFVVGVIYMPETDELYAAEQGCGAFRNGTRIHVSTRADLSACTMGFDSELRVDTARKLRALGRLCPQIFNIRLIGSSARNLSHVAEGVLDGVIEFSDKLWDFAAGVVIVMEAGGRMSRHDGAPLAARDSAYIASNGLIHQRLQEVALSA
jgi:myo-inositol-1(or 4)-monophosphatase